MREAADEEKWLAIERGDISPEGFPRVPITNVGAWCMRSYGKNSSSKGGIADILGYHTKKFFTSVSRINSAKFGQELGFQR